MSVFAENRAMLSIDFDRTIMTAASLMSPDNVYSAKARVSGEIRLLNSETKLNDYLVAFGEIHTTWHGGA